MTFSPRAGFVPRLLAGNKLYIGPQGAVAVRDRDERSCTVNLWHYMYFTPSSICNIGRVTNSNSWPGERFPTCT